MRFLSLGLDRYGRFTDRRLDFDPAARVVVVVGANEAGKTTALAAASDVLFGIGERSRYAFLHDYKVMRLSATIADGGGRTLSFARLKRRNASLVDPLNDAPLADDALAPFLGAHDADSFHAGFGLDQKRLRDGGAKLLAGGGDLAETLLAAAPGLDRVAALRERMKAEAAALFNPARANSKLDLHAAVARYHAAEKALRDSELHGETVRQARTAAEEAAHARAAAAEAENTAASAARRAQDLPRAARELRLIADEEARIAALGPLPQVEAGFPALARARLEAHRRARESDAQAQRDAAAARAVHDTLVVDNAILAQAEDVVRRDEERAQVEDKLASLPNRRREADAARTGLARIAAGLGLEGVEALRARLPGPPLLARAEALASRLHTHAVRRAALEEEAEALARRRRAAEAEALPEAEDPAPLKRLLDALDGAEERAAQADSTARRLAAARAALDARIARLPFGPWRPEDVARRPLPDRAAADAALARHATACEAHGRAVEQRDALAEQLDQIEARRSGLDGEGTAPTAQAVATAREARDALWRGLRPLALAQRPAAPEDGGRADEFERALAAADRLADHRLSESRRLADLARAEIELAELRVRHAAAQARADAAAADLAAAVAHWDTLWPQGTCAPAPGASALALLREVEDIRQALEALASQQADAERLAATALADRVRAGELHTALGLPPPGPEPLRLADAKAAAAARMEAFQRHREARHDRARLAQATVDLDDRRAALHAQHGAFAAEVAEVFPALSLRLGASAEEARAALGLWHEAAALNEQLLTAERRIAGIEQDEARFAAAMEALLCRLEESAASDPFSAARALRHRLDAAREARVRAQDAESHLAARTAAAAVARADLDTAQADLDTVLARAGVPDATALPEQVEKLEQAAQSAALMRDARQRLDDLRGTRSLAEVCADIAGRDDDALAGHAAEAAEAHAAARAARDAAVVADTRAQAALEELAGRPGAAHAAQEMQDAIADMGTAMERFTRAHAAARLLSSAIERYREAHQNPLVRRAGAAFATLTDGVWSGIGIDYDHTPPRLAAIREGRPHPVEALSEGTADQLFLALRVAAIEEHARRAIPLPFLADDLFVTFDEARTQAGMALLAELGAITQVIVFTHHAHVADCARRALGEAAAVIDL